MVPIEVSITTTGVLEDEEEGPHAGRPKKATATVHSKERFTIGHPFSRVSDAS
jgi:hypothetical protein